MNPIPNPHLEPTEAILRGWRPRRPSPSLRRRLFEGAPLPHTGAVEVGWAGGLSRWLAPAGGVAVLVLTAAVALNPSGLEEEAELSLARLGATWCESHPSVDRNAPLSAARFRSTNASAVTASFGFLLLRQTNVFAR